MARLRQCSICWLIASATRALLLVNYRPEYHHEWGNKTYYTELRLDALREESAAEMLSTLLGDGVELNPLKRLIMERTEGNPFFIEEMIQALFDQGAVVRNGEVKVARPLSRLQLPLTVQGILASRIDRLPRHDKELIQALAVIGRESSLALIRQALAREAGAELEHQLSALQAGEFIYEQRNDTEVVYIFKHALTQEVAYNSLLLESRKILHERVGQALEAMFASQLDDHVDELAQHYSCSANTSKAIEYLQRARLQAIRRSASTDAFMNLTGALNLLPKLADTSERIQRELPLQFDIASALIPVKGWAADEVQSAYTRARNL
jgi:predicted ATPase